MAEKEVYLSRDGLKKLEQELEYLKTVRRREIAERIRQAREYGDIAENSEYEDAKNEQAFIEGRILQLEKTLRNARILTENGSPSGRVGLGSRVRIRNLDLGEEEEYLIVGTLEANPAENRISDESPVGRAIMGQKVGAIVEVDAPAGAMRVQILEIH
ncbi:transcription elongation factor GreA [Caldinitratiruptor microaerophilus]|uniref:Transcription elongation factor GreA n=1 Tax=Caldinitratiruptor microaerophilus TaxID=671077 RepID=A0AA35CP24_9FIRM|nr:transcription elongation factor GreA [Caldinitratiruptor microaerophilus]BDG62098.1 transcription elongation factor GreA [Caldinitratiruptor microaerophilus]